MRERALHECIVDRNDKDFACVLELVVSDIAGDMRVGAGWGEGCWDADDEAFAGCKLFGEVDFVAGRVFGQVDGGDGVACFDLYAMLAFTPSSALFVQHEALTMIAGVEWKYLIFGSEAVDFDEVRKKSLASIAEEEVSSCIQGSSKHLVNGTQPTAVAGWGEKSSDDVTSTKAT